ncbi:MAG: recF protein [Bacteroidetes bacterium]|nr:MAG: recF protein [Bacteroidota bacterium]
MQTNCLPLPEMFLQKLSLVNFKNFEEAELAFSDKVNCFAGPNGSGKTNLLDALHYLGLCKSYFNPLDSQNIRHDEGFFVIQGTFIADDGAEEQVYCGMKRNQKKVFKRNQKEYERLADHIGLFPLVMVSPADGVLISGGSEERRRFMDSVIAQYDKNYLDSLIAYNRVLSQRNALLKQFGENRNFDAAVLEVFDAQLAGKGKPVYEARKAFIAAFTPIFADYYRHLSGAAEEVAITYQSKLHETSFEDLLIRSLPKDRIMQHCTAGVHKDDLEFGIGGYAMKKAGSQGQQKTFLIALRLAQFCFIRDTGKRMPVLLLDDIYDKLDENRVKKLMDAVCGKGFGQIFITDTGVGRIQELFENRGIPFRLFEIRSGKVNNQLKELPSE